MSIYVGGAGLYCVPAGLLHPTPYVYARNILATASSLLWSHRLFEREALETRAGVWEEWQQRRRGSLRR